MTTDQIIIITLVVLAFATAGYFLYRYAHGDESMPESPSKLRFIAKQTRYDRILISLRAQRVVETDRGYRLKTNWIHPLSWFNAMVVFIAAGLIAVVEFDNDQK